MNVNRSQLSKFLPDNESIRIFEELLRTASRADLNAGIVGSLPSPSVANSTTLVESGLSVPLTSNQTYKFEFFGAYTVASTGVGTRWVIDGPAAQIAYSSEWSLSATSKTINQLAAYNLPSSANAGSAAGGIVKFEGIIRPDLDGALRLLFASGGASEVNLLGGYCRLTLLT
jgi:hypothetical protein